MKNVSDISELRNLGFYQLKKLLGLGDERLRMILAVGEVKPILFTDVKTGRTDQLFPFFAVKDALRNLQGKDVQLIFETKYAGATDAGIQTKLNDVNLRLLKKRKKKAV